MPCFYDSYAIIEILERNKNYLKFSNNLITTSVLDLFEVHYYLLKKHNKITADYWAKKLNFNFIEIDPVVSIEASKFRFDNKKEKLSIVDCIGYILALKHNLKFLTGDEKFENKKNVEFVKK